MPICFIEAPVIHNDAKTNLVEKTTPPRCAKPIT
jgi:hypothetical protein